MKIIRYTLLLATLAVAASLIFSSLGSSAVRSNSHAQASSAKGPLIVFSSLGAACGDFCVQVHKGLFKALKAAGYTNTLELDNNLDPTRIIANAHTAVARRAAVYIDTDGGLTNYKVTLKLMKKADIPLFLLFGGPPAGNPPNVAWENANKATAGKLAGKFIASYVNKNWGGKIDGLFATWLASWSPADKEAINKMLPEVNKGLGTKFTKTSGITLFDGQGKAEPLQAAVTAFLNAHPGQHRLVFDASTSDADTASINTALQQAGRIGDAMVIGAGASAEGIKLLCNKNSAVKGDVDFAPGSWGPGIVRVVKLMLAKKPFPHIVEPNIRVVTSATVGKYFNCSSGTPK